MSQVGVMELYNFWSLAAWSGASFAIGLALGLALMFWVMSKILKDPLADRVGPPEQYQDHPPPSDALMKMINGRDTD